MGQHLPPYQTEKHFLYCYNLNYEEYREPNMRQTLNTLIISIATLFTQNVIAGEVTRAIFTIGIDNREPITQVDSINSNSYAEISFFTELTNLKGHTVTHQWVHNDTIIFEKKFEVNGDRWRVWTSKEFLPDWSGSWTVNVLDTDLSVLESKSFKYQ
jgi:hypothetical protein